MERRTPDATVAVAMNRVLAAESEAAEAIAAVECESDAIVEAARERRRQILETSRRRASRLHARGQERLRRELDALDSHQPREDADLAALRARARRALENLVARLTSDDHDPR